MIPLPKPIAGRRAPRPKLAATVVLLRNTGKNTEILMGKRSAKHDFLPNVYVFPGGRVDPCDSIAPALGGMLARTRTILENAMTPRRARACVLAAVRETFEETSLILGEKTQTSKVNCGPSWQDFHAHGYLPVLDNIEVFARAITPPYHDKRFDTWFFLARLDTQTANRPFQNSAELVDTNWFTFAQLEKLDTHRATQMMLKQLAIYLAQDKPEKNVFFSCVRHGKFNFSRYPS